jgi:hypothetical protein
MVYSYAGKRACGPLSAGSTGTSNGACLRRSPALRVEPGICLRACSEWAAQTEVGCHDTPKKVIPFPARKTSSPLPGTEEHSRITIHMGAHRYSLNIPRPPLAAPPEPAAPRGRLEELQVQTRFLRLRAPAAVGDRIDGWRVCWVGGWDKGKVLFVVMVERVVRATSP